MKVFLTSKDTGLLQYMWTITMDYHTSIYKQVIEEKY